jgi:hypothetical protein
VSKNIAIMLKSLGSGDRSDGVGKKQSQKMLATGD